MENLLTQLEPRHKYLIFDLAAEAGFDVSDWINSANNPKSIKSNPKYCYEWAYFQPGKLIILNLWHATLEQSGQLITFQGNFRRDANRYDGIPGQSAWARRATKIDEALKNALTENLAVRVVLLRGKRRSSELPDDMASVVEFRELDPEPWTISKYDWATGECQLTRGIISGAYADQFDLQQIEKLENPRRTSQISPYIRSPEVRRKVMMRSNGYCELCRTKGFRMASGALYLETHHIIPLSEGGQDNEANVVALCATDHRRAHYGAERENIRNQLLKLSNSLLKTQLNRP